MNAGLTGDAPVKAVADAVSAFASPAGAADATLKALVKKFGLESATNAVAGSVGSACSDGSCADQWAVLAKLKPGPRRPGFFQADTVRIPNLPPGVRHAPKPPKSTVYKLYTKKNLL